MRHFFYILGLMFMSHCLQASPLVIRQIPVKLQTDRGLLFGSLLIPLHNHPIPVALLVTGSGPLDRNGNAPGNINNSQKLLANALAENGIASLRYDKRGVAQSLAAEPNEEEVTVRRYAKDVTEWGHMLHKDSRFTKTILIGHSEGALLVSLSANKSQAQALISIAGPAHPVDVILRNQLKNRLPKPLLSESNQIMNRLLQQQITWSVSPQLTTLFRPSVQPYLISLFSYNPTQVFAHVQLPSLIIQGDHDIQVSVIDAKKLHAANPSSELAIIKGMNHIFRIVPLDLTKQLASYNNAKAPISQDLIQKIITFINMQK